MNHRVGQGKWTQRIWTQRKLIPILCALLFLSACADRGVTRDLERDRYAQLESEIISAKEVEERRRAAEFKVAQKLQKLESDRTAAARKQLQAQEAIYFASQNNPEPDSNLENKDRALSSSPAVTQIAMGQSSTASPVWKVKDYPSPLDGSPMCSVVSTPSMVRNGALNTFVTIVVSDTAVFLRTDATFDPDALETGYLIDAGLPIAFDSFINVLTAVVDDNYERLVSTMRSGTTLSVAFGYAPQLSTSDTHVMELSLDSFAKALSALELCADEATTIEPSNTNDPAGS